jgi:hypothetical protein
VKIAITSIHNHGDHSKEFVILSVREKANLKHFLLADTTYVNDGKAISNLTRHTYWFPPTEVCSSDVVVLHTRPGTYSKEPFRGGFMHHFYWCLQKAVWNDSGDVAVLYQIDEWQTMRAK